jgi:PAS domain S-box-containing protein
VPHRDNGARRLGSTTAGTKEALGDALVDALRGAGDGSFVTDPEGRIILWNGAAEAMLGHTAAEVLGRPCCRLLRGEDVDGDAGCAPACALGAHAPWDNPIATFDMRTRTKAGLGLWINVSVLVIADPRTRAPFILHLFRAPAPAHEGLLLQAAAPKDSTALTRREREVLGLMAEGLNTVAMARRLHLSRATVRNHVQSILLKLGVHSRLEAVAHGLRHRLFPSLRKETT